MMTSGAEKGRKMNWNNGHLILTDSSDRINIQRVYELLRETYWGVRRPLEAVDKMVKHSLCFSLFDNDIQIGFGRAVTDYTVFSWIADIVIDPAYRGRGLGKWMMACILDHPELRKTQFVLQTRDAHTLYERYGFSRNSALMSTTVAGL